MSKGYAAVIGAVNIDIWGRSFAPLIERDSNPGEILISFGGVGRNIAHNMCLLGMNVSMLTAIGEDMWADKIRTSCGEIGIDLSRALNIPGGSTSTYMFITGPDGEMSTAVCDADITKYITPEFLEKNLDLLNNAQLVVLDGNLTYETIEYITTHCTAPLFADPVSVTKADKLAPYIGRLHTFKPNDIEAMRLTGEDTPEKAARALVQKGAKRVFVSDGARGIVAAEGETLLRVPCYRTFLRNCTGGGDAVLAALCRAHIDGLSLEESAKFALAAGSLAVSCAETINPEMSLSAIAEIIANG